ncbi:type 2 lanthipeptide synthetase LanM [Halocatena halophila]|uniref:type 2 lanthipeptide synthetase LanM n=1 Tax=Halocatena halophila TaxID=2814576 RepID=UPI002ECFC1EB
MCSIQNEGERLSAFPLLAITFMNFTQEEKVSIAGKARTLQERVAHPAPSGDVVEEPKKWIEEWSDRVADGDPARFSKRLERLGLSQDEIRVRIRRHGWPTEKPLPDWIDRLDELIQFVAQHDSPPNDREGAADRPFAPLLSSSVSYAETHLDQHTFSSHLSASARDDLREVLASRLESYCAHPLFIEFKTFIAKRDPSLAFNDIEDARDPPQQYYEQFVEELRDGGLKAFFTEYAFLGRLVGSIIVDWQSMVAEFSERLDSDYDQLVATFGKGHPLGAVTALDPLGEPHHGGRYVFRLVLESGQSIAYKPRSLAVEEAFNEFLSWVNRTSEFPSFRTPTYLSRDTHGWMEWISTEVCATSDDARAYFRRAGMLIALLYGLNFSDGNLENVIAAGDQPVLIDLETLAQPDAADDMLPVSGNTRQTLLASVLRTGLVPFELPTEDVHGTSGFGSNQAFSPEAECREFQNINTDVMDLTYQQGKAIEGDNLPKLNESVVSADEYIEDIIGGFDEMFQFLRQQGERAGSPPLSCFEGIDIRVLFRSTTSYAKILTLLTTPAYLRSGLPFGCKVEELAKPLLSNKTDAVWPLYESERMSLLHCDFPRFEATTDESVIRGDDQTVEEFFEVTGCQRIRQRLSSLTVRNHETQRQHLERGFGEAFDSPSPH